jgi:hypothetical protein
VSTSARESINCNDCVFDRHAKTRKANTTLGVGNEQTRQLCAEFEHAIGGCRKKQEATAKLARPDRIAETLSASLRSTLPLDDRDNAPGALLPSLQRL